MLPLKIWKKLAHLILPLRYWNDFYWIKWMKFIISVWYLNGASWTLNVSCLCSYCNSGYQIFLISNNYLKSLNDLNDCYWIKLHITSVRIQFLLLWIELDLKLSNNSVKSLNDLNDFCWIKFMKLIISVWYFNRENWTLNVRLSSFCNSVCTKSFLIMNWIGCEIVY